MGNGTNLVDCYRQVLDEDPASEVFVFLAEALYSQNRWEEIIHICRRGLEIHPRHLRARVLLGLALWETGNRANAQEELEKARIALERNAVLYKVLTELAQDGGDTGRAGRFLMIYQSMGRDTTQDQDLQPSSRGAEERPQQIEMTVVAEKEEARDAEEDIHPLLILLSRWQKEHENREIHDSLPIKILTEKERRMLRRLLSD